MKFICCTFWFWP